MGTVSGDVLAGGGGDEKIFVSIRLRPLNVKERARNDVSDWECVNDDTIIYRNNLSVSERSMYPTGYTFGENILPLSLQRLCDRCFLWYHIAANWVRYDRTVQFS